MATYNLYPGMDSSYNFPPQVRSAIANSPELQDALNQGVSNLVDSRFDSIENDAGLRDERLDTIDTNDGVRDSRLTTLENNDGDQDNRLTALENNDGVQDNRLTTLERDTGWRDVTGLLENGWVAERVWIRRIGSIVHFSHRGLDGRDRTAVGMITLPTSFAPRRTLVSFNHTSGAHRALINGTGVLEPPSDIADAAPYSYASAESMWGVPSAAWPTTLPGIPV